jgi:hypothetical protein
LRTLARSAVWITWDAVMIALVVRSGAVRDPLFARLVHRPLSTAEGAGIATSFAAVVTFDLAVFAVATVRGIRALQELRR